MACGESGSSDSSSSDAGGQAGAGDPDASGTSGQAGTGGAAGTGGNAGNTDASGESDSTTNACAGRAGPSMIDVQGFCIDATEVTQAHYSLFVADIATNPPVQTAACSWNSSFSSNAMTDPTGDDLPVRGVDWCDAHAYCTWAGKRLCGRIGGGMNAYDAPADATMSQWYAACSARGAKAFPYGDAYEEQACNGGDYGGPEVAPLPVGSVSTCEGGYPGIYDMSGNAWEWEDSCETQTGASDLCRARGGAFGNGADFHRCDYAGFFPARDFAAGPVGIRCCSP